MKNEDRFETSGSGATRRKRWARARAAPVIGALVMISVSACVHSSRVAARQPRASTPMTASTAASTSTRVFPTGASPSPTLTEPSTRASTLPGVIWECTSPAPQGQQSRVEPTGIVIACADDGIGVRSLAWTSWTTSAAAGAGRVWENTCVPNCATGTIKYYSAMITLSGAENTSEGPLFTRLTAVYHPAGPQGHTTDQFQLPLPPE